MSATDLTRWDAGVGSYEAYLDTALGRLREELAWRHTRAALPDPAGDPPLVLDAGCGPGRLTARLAADGYRIVALDPSRAMLDQARARVAELGPEAAGRVAFLEGSFADAFARLGPAGADTIVCHSVLEHIPDPTEALTTCAAMLRSGGILAILTVNRWGEAVRAAFATGTAAAVLDALRRREVPEQMLGGTRRLGDPDELRAQLASAGIVVTAIRGIRVLADYLPDAPYADLLAIETALAETAPDVFARVGRHLHIVGRKDRGGE